MLGNVFRYIAKLFSYIDVSFFKNVSHLGYYRILSRVLCATEYFLVGSRYVGIESKMIK